MAGQWETRLPFLAANQKLVKQVEVVKPTGSVTTDWATPSEAQSMQPNESERAEIRREKEVRWNMVVARIKRVFDGASK